MDQLEPVPIRGTEGADGPFFSPDGQWVGFFAGGQLKRVSLLGGTPLTVCDIPTRVATGSWSSDDTIVWGGPGLTLRQVPASGGTPEPITTLDDELGLSHWGPQVLPGGKAVLFTGARRGSDGPRHWIAAQSLETGERRRLVDGMKPHFAPSGHLLFTREGSDALWAVAFDPDSLSVAGDPVPVLDGVEMVPGVAAHVSLSDTGTLVYVPTTTRPLERRFAWVDRNGIALEPATATLAATPWNFRLSPDGERLAVSLGLFSEARLWVYDMIGTRPPHQLTFDGRASGPVWEPDGSHVVFDVDSQLERIPADGRTQSGESIAGLRGRAYHWSPDGRLSAVRVT